ncbi:Transcriptional regulator, LysR [Bacillus cereus Rock4-18]|nr:Transcriptional regulator, LysR [Bacillus cereus Rock4-18]
MNIRGLNSDNDNYVNELSIWAAYFIFPHSLRYFEKYLQYPY